MTLGEFTDLLLRNSGLEPNDLGLSHCRSGIEADLGLMTADPSVLFDLIYKHFDGQEGPFNIFCEFRLNSLQDSLEFFEDHRTEFAHQESGDCRDKRIEDGFLWRNGWFPFAWDDFDNRLLVMDFDPSGHGEVGQIFLYDCRQSLGDWIAPNLPSFLDALYTKLVTSKFDKNEVLRDRFTARIDGRRFD